MRGSGKAQKVGAGALNVASPWDGCPLSSFLIFSQMEMCKATAFDWGGSKHSDPVWKEGSGVTLTLGSAGGQGSAETGTVQGWWPREATVLRKQTKGKSACSLAARRPW